MASNIEAFSAQAVGLRSPFEHAGVIVFTSTAGTDVRFDNFTVRKE